MVWGGAVTGVTAVASAAAPNEGTLIPDARYVNLTNVLQSMPAPVTGVPLTSSLNVTLPLFGTTPSGEYT